MKFNILLYVLFRKLRKASKGNQRFKKFIKDKSLRVTIKTADGQKGRQYIFSNGKVFSMSITEKEADTAMVWADGETAFKVMSSSNEEASVAALTDRTLQVEGDFKEFMWFSRALEIMMGKA